MASSTTSSAQYSLPLVVARGIFFHTKLIVWMLVLPKLRFFSQRIFSCQASAGARFPTPITLHFYDPNMHHTPLPVARKWLNSSIGLLGARLPPTLPHPSQGWLMWLRHPLCPHGTPSGRQLGQSIQYPFWKSANFRTLPVPWHLPHFSPTPISFGYGNYVAG